MAQVFDEAYFNGKTASSYVYYEQLDAKRQFQSVLGFIKENSLSGKLLDVGCAMGLFLKEAGAYFDELHGCDISQYALSKAWEKVSEAKYKVVDLDNSLPYPDESFDLVTGLDVLEHTRHFAENFGRLASKVKPGGYLIVSMPIDALPRKLLGFLDKDRTHVSVLKEREILKVVKGLGLELVMKRHFSLTPLGYKVRYVPAEVELVLRKPIREEGQQLIRLLTLSSSSLGMLVNQ
jgi:2-polyprenyl-3-methyl-5-hydroxy-6-metoxy-1,4-benzoquinol methylase